MMFCGSGFSLFGNPIHLPEGMVKGIQKECDPEGDFRPKNWPGCVEVVGHVPYAIARMWCN